MKLPRDLNGDVLVNALRALGYEKTRRKGSHLRITTHLKGQHHEVIPMHKPLKMGTLAGIPKSIASHHQISVGELLETLKL